MVWRHSHVRNLYRHILYIVDHEPVILSVRHFIQSACFRQSVRVYHSSHSTLSLVQPSAFNPSILDLWNPPLHLTLDNLARNFANRTGTIRTVRRERTYLERGTTQVRLRLSTENTDHSRKVKVNLRIGIPGDAILKSGQPLRHVHCVTSIPWVFRAQAQRNLDNFFYFVWIEERAAYLGKLVFLRGNPVKR